MLTCVFVCVFVSSYIQEVFDQVDFKQANLANPISAEKVFQCGEGEAGFDYVFNLAAETKYSQSDEVTVKHVISPGDVQARLPGNLL